VLVVDKKSNNPLGNLSKYDKQGKKITVCQINPRHGS